MEPDLELVQQALSILQERSESNQNPENYGHRTVHAILTGAAASLMAFRSTLRALLADSDTRFEDSTWHQTPTEPARALLAALKAHQDLPWNSASMAPWSLGYFLNRAQHNIAAAFDVWLNAALADKLFPDTFALRDEALKLRLRHLDTVFHIWIGTRVVMLAWALPSGRRRSQLEAVAEWLGKLTSYDHWPIATGDGALTPDGIDAAFEQAINQDSEECLARMIQRTNAFKHLLQGTMDRTARHQITEAAGAARALLLMTQFWFDPWDTMKPHKVEVPVGP
jgi:hypothetical protein